MCSLIDEDALSRYRRAAGDEETGHVFNLWPASKLTAQLHIVNGANKLGPGSTPPLEFETLEGGVCCLCVLTAEVCDGVETG
jgi:hypothetical protein